MGDWVMITALNRMEAGAFHALAGRPEKLSLDDYPWHIALCHASEENDDIVSSFKELQQSAPISVDRIEKKLAFHYPHAAATATPSKMTATSLKGREKDKEISEKAPEIKHPVRNWRTPSFVKGTISGKEYGNVVHAVMQYISYEYCDSIEGIRSEITKLTDRGFLTEQQAQSVDIEMILRFFETPVGQKLRSGVSYLREFKFSILDQGSHYHPELADEKILLQGVVDCAILEDDGITVLDFKTDYVTQESLPGAIDRYKAQVTAYADAMRRIYEKPVKKTYLYFFRTNSLIAL